MSLRPKRHSSKACAAKSGWQQWLAMFAVLALALQAQITQSHIHFAPVSETGIDALVHALATAPNDAPLKKNSPARDNAATCPICQAMAHSGQFVTPSAAVLLLPSEAAVVVPLLLPVAAAIEAISHGWQSRAPPHA